MSNNYKDTGMELQREEVDALDDERTHWPGQIALSASLLLGQMERGMRITDDSIACIDIAITKLNEAKEVIGERDASR